MEMVGDPVDYAGILSSTVVLVDLLRYQVKRCDVVTQKVLVLRG